jgi:hypothetical protein
MGEMVKNFDEVNNWRAILRSTGSTLLWMMILLVLGGLYLAVSSKAAQAGRNVMELEVEFNQKQLVADELTADLADLTSPQRMRSIAQSLGFRDATTGDVIYLDAVGIEQEEVFVPPAPRTLRGSQKQGVSPAYTETLIDAFQRWLSTGPQE